MDKTTPDFSSYDIGDAPKAKNTLTPNIRFVKRDAKHPTRPEYTQAFCGNIAIAMIFAHPKKGESHTIKYDLSGITDGKADSLIDAMLEVEAQFTEWFRQFDIKSQENK